MIGHQGDQANHQYDIPDFWHAANSGNLPAVSFIKAPAYQDGNAGYSNPLLEQQFVADFINRLQALPTWGQTAVILAWDDSGGWYDHVMSPIVNQSQTARDALTGAGLCGSNTTKLRVATRPVADTELVCPFSSFLHMPSKTSSIMASPIRLPSSVSSRTIGPPGASATTPSTRLRVTFVRCSTSGQAMRRACSSIRQPERSSARRNDHAV